MLSLSNKIYHRRLIFSLSQSILQERKGLKTVPFAQQQAIMKINDQVFNNALIKVFINLSDAFNKLKVYNQNVIQDIIINYTPPPTLSVNTKLGEIKITGEIQLSTLYYISPFTGIYKYYYDEKADRWFSNKDKHIFEQNLSREVMSKFKGILEI